MLHKQAVHRAAKEIPTELYKTTTLRAQHQVFTYRRYHQVLLRNAILCASSPTHRNTVSVDLSRKKTKQPRSPGDHGYPPPLKKISIESTSRDKKKLTQMTKEFGARLHPIWDKPGAYISVYLVEKAGVPALLRLVLARKLSIFS